MNAYELAEQAEGLAYEIPADWSSGEPKNVATDIANMLRQQADRIKDLEKLLEHSIGADCREMRYIQEIENKDARIAELEKDLEGCEYFLDKQQSAEPVAWIKKDTLIFLGNYEFGSITIQVQKQKDDEFDIPLYTTPQIKELSDEEITEVLNDENIAEYHQGNWLVLPYAFARAILKKASQ
jgi:hypothetical protein